MYILFDYVNSHRYEISIRQRYVHFDDVLAPSYIHHVPISYYKINRFSDKALAALQARLNY